jgi:hypothetical protein
MQRSLVGSEMCIRDRVCSEVAEKFWADTPGIYVEVREL